MHLVCKTAVLQTLCAEPSLQRILPSWKPSAQHLLLTSPCPETTFCDSLVMPV